MLNWFKKKSPIVATPDESVKHVRQPIEAAIAPLETTSADVLLSEGLQLYEDAQYDAAVSMFERVLTREPKNLIALYQIANADCARGRYAEGKRACHRALGRWPDQPDLLVLMATIDGLANDDLSSLTTLQRVRKVNPDFVRIDVKIAEVLCKLGRGPEAIAAFDLAIVKEPDALDIRSVRLFFLNYFDLLDRRSLFGEHCKWGLMVDERFASLRRPHPNELAEDRPLRIGIVSPDLRNHAIAYFIEGYFREHDRGQYPIYCFDASPFPEDDVTAALRLEVDGWHVVASLTDNELCELIRDQQIDILIDLSGHTAHNRLMIFAQRPAPVQVSWFGYMNTTGLTSMDYRLTDLGHDPEPDAHQYYSEKLHFIPSLACFAPPQNSPDVSPSPFLRKGKVTFGSVNQWAKVTEAVKDLWAEILRGDSNPRLRIIATSAVTEKFREDVVKEFVRRGVNKDQIDVLPRMDMREFQESFSEIDVSLDPFPYGGGTTTLHTIWMGVPILALEGDGELARATPAMLRGFGLADFVALTVDEYRDKAIALARDPSTLVEIRANLRQRMADSPALDATGLAHNVENAFRTMWHTYCAQVTQTPAGETIAPTQSN